MVWREGLKETFCWRGVWSLIGGWKYFKKEAWQERGGEKMERRDCDPQRNYGLNKIFISSMIFILGKSKKIDVLDYAHFTWINGVCSDFVTKFIEATGTVAPIKKVRIKSNSKHPFEFETIWAIFRTTG